jgi:glycosyltransferase involved in cell wall biosynthesis
MRPPKLSVIVPSYNHGHFLRERIDSILNQSFQDFELIFLDDCSTDNSVAILREYEAHPFRSGSVAWTSPSAS